MGFKDIINKASELVKNNFLNKDIILSDDFLDKINKPEEFYNLIFRFTEKAVYDKNLPYNIKENLEKAYAGAKYEKALNLYFSEYVKIYLPLKYEKIFSNKINLQKEIEKKINMLGDTIKKYLVPQLTKTNVIISFVEKEENDRIEIIMKDNNLDEITAPIKKHVVIQNNIIEDIKEIKVEDFTETKKNKKEEVNDNLETKRIKKTSKPISEAVLILTHEYNGKKNEYNIFKETELILLGRLKNSFGTLGFFKMDDLDKIELDKLKTDKKYSLIKDYFSLEAIKENDGSSYLSRTQLIIDVKNASNNILKIENLKEPITIQQKDREIKLEENSFKNIAIGDVFYPHPHKKEHKMYFKLPQIQKEKEVCILFFYKKTQEVKKLNLPIGEINVVSKSFNTSDKSYVFLDEIFKNKTKLIEKYNVDFKVSFEKINSQLTASKNKLKISNYGQPFNVEVKEDKYSILGMDKEIIISSEGRSIEIDEEISMTFFIVD